MIDQIRTLATPRVAAGALFFDPAGRVLLVHPRYKGTWDIPGGYVERGESPAAACRREVAEELGFDRLRHRLVSVDWEPHGQQGDTIFFLFDYGDLDTDEHRLLHLDGDKLNRWRWVELAQLDRYVNPRVARRIRSTADDAATDGTDPSYLENGEPPAQTHVPMAPPAPDPINPTTTTRRALPPPASQLAHPLRTGLVLVASLVLLTTVVTALTMANLAARTPIRTTIPTIPVGSNLRAMAVTPDGRHAYVTSNDGVWVIDTGSNTVTTTIPIAIPHLPPRQAPLALAITPNGHHVYITTYKGLSVIDTISNTVIATIPLGSNPHGVAVTPDGRHAYVTTYRGLSVIDTISNTVTSTIPAAASQNGVAITPDGRHAYLTSSLSNTVSVIDTASNTITTTIPVGLGPVGVAITPDGRHVYVTTTTHHGTVSVIDTTSNSVTTTIPMDIDPSEVAVAPDGRHAYITSSFSNTVSVIDTASNTITTDIAVGTDPREVAITPDGRYAYVANYGSVSVIDITHR